MKLRLVILVLAVASFVGLSPAAKANGPITIGLNTGGPLSLIRGANVSWARGGIYWRDVNPNPGEFNYAAVDSLVNEAHDNQLSLLYILSGAPTWCGSSDNGAKPCDIDSWKTFVDQLTQHIHGLPNGSTVGAFEIWNEPDLSYSGTFGVGWDSDWNTYPRYVDYIAEAGKIIHRNHPGAKVVGPVLSGKRSDVYRLQHVFQDFENDYYYDDDGVLHNASYFVDVISGHMDCHDASTHSEDASYLYQTNVLNWISDYNPSSRYKEQWITEISWKSGDIGEDSQRVREKNFMIEMTGGGYMYLYGWNFTQGFIYVCQNGGTTESVYYNNNAPKKVVYQYLQPLGFPAIQQAGVPRE
jgi:hypothetical protein